MYYGFTLQEYYCWQIAQAILDNNQEYVNLVVFWARTQHFQLDAILIAANILEILE